MAQVSLLTLVPVGLGLPRLGNGVAAVQDDARDSLTGYDVELSVVRAGSVPVP